MSMTKVNSLFVLSLGIFLVPNAVESKCTCIKGKIINDFCCESANSPPSTKDACCHVDGLRSNPPNWVPGGPGPIPSPTQSPKPEECKSSDGKPQECIRNADCGFGCKCEDCRCLCEENPDPNVCPLDSECSSDEECKPTKEGEICNCASCNCVCATVSECTEESSCRTDAECQVSGGERNECKCAGCVCDCPMSPDECVGGDCVTDSDCSVNNEDGKPMDCTCENCSCFCEDAGDNGEPEEPEWKERNLRNNEAPGGCTGGDCKTDSDCKANDVDGKPMDCQCSNCSCFCEDP